jgi:hypothetical protein
MTTPGSRRERGPRSFAKNGRRAALSAALVAALLASLISSCGTSGGGAGASANQSMPSSARGKRLSTIVNDGCTSDDDHFCALGTVALKVQLDEDLSKAGFFSAVSNDRPDFKLTVTLTKTADDALLIFYDDINAAAKFELADNTGKVVFAGTGSGNSSKPEEALKKLAADITAKLKL